MTTVAKVSKLSTKVMEESLTCYICYNLLREPKDLDCPHVYCLQCLQAWVKQKPTIECPECRSITFVPQGGLANLKTNLRLKNLVENYVKGVERPKDAPMCPDHNGERQLFFCVSCGITVCHNCLVLKHPRPKHEIKELKEVKNAEDEKKVKKIDDIERNLTAAKQQAERAIKARVQQIMADAEVRGEEMIQCIQTTYQQRMETLQQGKQNQSTKGRLSPRHPSPTRYASITADRMKQDTSDVDTNDKLCITQNDMYSEDMATLRFNPGSGPLNQAWFGEVVLSKRELTLKHVNEFGNFQLAQGVTLTQAGLLVVVDAVAKAKKGTVTVYEEISGIYRQKLCLGCSTDPLTKKMTYPLGLAVTPQGEICVTDNGAEVHVYSPACEYKRSFPVTGERIATTPDDIIVISSVGGKHIRLYQPNGKMVRTYEIDFGHIECIASNGKQIAFTTRHQEPGNVCVIDFVTGQTLWTVDMVQPRGICYEQKSNTLLVAGGSKTIGQFLIEQYCSTTGRLISRVASGLYNPLAMTVTQNSKLVVADWKTVKIYSIQ